MAECKEGTAFVEFDDVLSTALEAAMARIEIMAPKLGQTLVDVIPAAQWANWDASSEKAIASDPIGIDDADVFDHDQPQAA
jgi:hypothetical protein